MENGATQVNNVVHSFRLQASSFDKKVSERSERTGTVLRDGEIRG